MKWQPSTIEASWEDARTHRKPTLCKDEKKYSETVGGVQLYYLMIKGSILEYIALKYIYAQNKTPQYEGQKLM